MPLGDGKPTCTAAGRRGRPRGSPQPPPGTSGNGSGRWPIRFACGFRWSIPTGCYRGSRRGAAAVFTWPALAVWIGMVGYALYLAGSGWARIESSAAVILDRDNWLRLAAAWVLAQGPARDGTRSGVQTLWRNGRHGGNHASVLHAAGLCRCHVVVAFSFEMAADCDRGGRHLRRAFRGLDRDHRLGDFIARHRANDGLEHRLDRRREHARIQRQPAGAIRRLLHPLRPARCCRIFTLAANNGWPTSCKRTCWAAKPQPLPGRGRKPGS